MDSNTELAAELKAAMNDADRGIAGGASPSFTDGHRRFIGLAWSNREAIITALTQQPADHSSEVRNIVPAEQIADGALGVTQDQIDAVSEAIEKAQCLGREGPYGGYDFGHNTAFYGPEPKDGRYVIRDFRDPQSPDWGKWVHQTHDKAEHEAKFERMTKEHIAFATIRALQPHGQGGGE